MNVEFVIFVIAPVVITCGWILWAYVMRLEEEHRRRYEAKVETNEE